MYEDIPASRFINMKRCDQDGLMMPSSFVNNGEDKKIWEMKPRPDDIWIVTYPKCGTTMTQELVWQVISIIKYKTYLPTSYQTFFVVRKLNLFNLLLNCNNLS